MKILQIEIVNNPENWEISDMYQSILDSDKPNLYAAAYAVVERRLHFNRLVDETDADIQADVEDFLFENTKGDVITWDGDDNFQLIFTEIEEPTAVAATSVPVTASPISATESVSVENTLTCSVQPSV